MIQVQVEVCQYWRIYKNIVERYDIMERNENMSRKFTLMKDYYEEGKNLYKKESITINPGITVLVGCNGIGKTTLLHQMRDRLKKDNIPYIEFDNLHNGGSKSISEASFYGDFGFMATAMCSSEGENIVMNIGKLAERLGKFVKEGEDPKEKKFTQLAKSLAKINGEDVKEESIPNERWILLDAVDSGLSVDNVVDIKEQLFKTILEYNYGNDIYIVISANAYEMARNEQCFDVYDGEYVEFKEYEEYRQFVLDSKEWKNERSKKQ